jgi:hypothetical protein
LNETVPVTITQECIATYEIRSLSTIIRKGGRTKDLKYM